MAAILGWDIGGANVKAALVLDGRLVVARSEPFEIRRSPGDLTEVLREMHARVLRDARAAGYLSDTSGAVVHAVTMTAELARVFRTKRDGVRTVLDAVDSACAGAEVHVFAVDGQWRTPADARRDWLEVAAANWSATARLVAGTHPDAVLVDTGSTTTDLIPIVGGTVVAAGRTDLDRLASGELVYTGAVRTPVEALASHAVVHGRSYALAAEAFALAGDVHVWRGALLPTDYTVETPDGRPVTRAFAGERLRRALCADTHSMTDTDVDDLAADLAHAQVARIADALGRIRARHSELRVAVVAGLGAFIGAAAARRAGCEVRLLADTLGDGGARHAPAAAVALFLAVIDNRNTVVPLSTDAQAQHDAFVQIAEVEYRLSPAGKCEATGVRATHPMYATLRERQHPGLVLFSSGSTGKPKAAVHDLASLLEKFQTPRHAYRTIVFLQLDHIVLPDDDCNPALVGWRKGPDCPCCERVTASTGSSHPGCC